MEDGEREVACGHAVFVVSETASMDHADQGIGAPRRQEGVISPHTLQLMYQIR